MLLDPSQDSAHVWKGPGPAEENVMGDADDSKHVWRAKMPEEENAFADADVPSLLPCPVCEHLGWSGLVGE